MMTKKRYAFMDKMDVKRHGEHGFVMYNHLISGEYSLSVQASEYTYCTPRKTLEDLADYTHMEIAVLYWNNESGKGDFIDVVRHFQDFPRRNELVDHDDGGVYAYVPVDLIEDLYQYMLKMPK